MKCHNFTSLAEVRTVFPTADKVGKFTVFNIGGNKARLITALHYNRHKVYIRAVLTHAEYDQNRWKEYAMLQQDMGNAVQAWSALARLYPSGGIAQRLCQTLE
jgi:ribosomal protein L2